MAVDRNQGARFYRLCRGRYEFPGPDSRLAAESDQSGRGGRAALSAHNVAGVRAAFIHDHFSARQGVEDDHVNVICLGVRTMGPAVASDLVDTFLAAGFSSAERHLRRLAKVASREAQG